jgi:hypothetical protein
MDDGERARARDGPVGVLHGRVDGGWRNSGDAFGRWGVSSGEAPRMADDRRMAWARSPGCYAGNDGDEHGASRDSTAGARRGYGCRGAARASSGCSGVDSGEWRTVVCRRGVRGNGASSGWLGERSGSNL